MAMQKIAFLSDIHGNSPALQAVLNDMQRKECTQVFMLGDIVNGVDPHGCVQLLRNWCAKHNAELTCIKGNGEEYLLTPDRHLLPDQDQQWNVDMINLAQWWEDHLTANDIEWIKSFPNYVRWDDVCLVHDRPTDRLTPESWHKPGIESKYQEWFFHSPGLVPATTEDEWKKQWELMNAKDITLVFCAHTHIPFFRAYEGKRIYNTGSAGIPSDGDPRSAWVLGTQSSNGYLDLEIRRVDYDIKLIFDLIEQTPDYYDFKDLNFKEAYKKWLATGIFWRAHFKEDD